MFVVNVDNPVLTLEDIDGEWKSVPPDLRYLLRELPVRLREIRSLLADIYNFDFDPPENSHWFSVRQKQCHCRPQGAAPSPAYTQTRLASGPRAPLQVMWDAHRREQRHRQIIMQARKDNRKGSEVS